MTSDLTSSIGAALLSYTGPEQDRVRTAIAALAKDDLDKVRHYLACANTDYRDVLWWAEQDAQASKNRAMLSGMTVNERLSHLGLMNSFDQAVAHGDMEDAKRILRVCELSEANIEAAVTAAFRRA